MWTAGLDQIYLAGCPKTADLPTVKDLCKNYVLPLTRVPHHSWKRMKRLYYHVCIHDNHAYVYAEKEETTHRTGIHRCGDYVAILTCMFAVVPMCSDRCVRTPVLRHQVWGKCSLAGPWLRHPSRASEAGGVRLRRHLPISCGEARDVKIRRVRVSC